MADEVKRIDLMAALVRSLNEERLEAGDVGGAHYLHSTDCKGFCDYGCNPDGFEQAARWWPERATPDTAEETTP